MSYRGQLGEGFDNGSHRETIKCDSWFDKSIRQTELRGGTQNEDILMRPHRELLPTQKSIGPVSNEPRYSKGEEIIPRLLFSLF